LLSSEPSFIIAIPAGFFSTHYLDRIEDATTYPMTLFSGRTLKVLVKRSLANSQSLFAKLAETICRNSIHRHHESSALNGNYLAQQKLGDPALQILQEICFKNFLKSPEGRNAEATHFCSSIGTSGIWVEGVKF